MRNLLLTLNSVVVLAGAALAGPGDKIQDSARDIVAQAVIVHGGADLLNKYPAARIKAKGSMAVPGTSLPFVVLHSFQAPDKVRLVQTYMTPAPLAVRTAGVFQVPNRSLNKTILQVGAKVRLFVDRQEVVPVPSDQVTSYGNALHVQNISRLVPLLDASFCTLTLVDTATVCDRPAQGVRVAVGGKKDINLYFDKGTGMLVKAAYSGQDAMGQVAPIEEIYTNYKDVRGVMYPSKTQILVRGRPNCEYEVLEFLPLEKFDPSEFANP